MTTDAYKTIFELGPRSFPWQRVIQPLIFLTMGLLLIKFFKNKRPYLVVGVFVASMASLFLLISMVIFIPNFVLLRTAYTSGKTVVVEGVVQNFRPAPSLGPAIESFSVDGVSFAYNALDNTSCFHNAPFRGGPIREGMDVRIHYYGDCIQRIDLLH